MIKALCDMVFTDVEYEVSATDKQNGDVRPWMKGMRGLTHIRTVVPVVHTLMELSPSLPAPDLEIEEQRTIESPEDIWELVAPLEPIEDHNSEVRVESTKIESENDDGR